jgi:hypothetical protein
MSDPVRTDDVMTTQALAQFFEMPEEDLGDVVQTCAGEWRRNRHDEMWTFWKDEDE